MSKLKVVFCVLTYNRAEYLRQSLCAMVAQTYKDIEIIVSDNASTDNTADVVKSFNDDRIRHIVRESNLGDNGNYLKVIHETEADFLFITHDDDIADLNYIERIMKEFNENKEIVAVGSNVRIIDYLGNVTEDSLYLQFKDRSFDKNTYLLEYLNTGLWIPPSTLGIRWNEQVKNVMTLLKKDEVQKIGGNADVYLCCLLNTLGGIMIIADPLASYREHGNQMSMKDNFKKGTSLLLKALRKLYAKINNKKMISVVEQAMHTAEIQEFLLSESGSIEKKIEELLRRIYEVSPQTSKAPFLSLVAALTNCPYRFSNVELNFQSTRVDLSLKEWVRMVDSNEYGPFKEIKKTNEPKIAILGSMSIAALLAMHAKRLGLSVVCFLDGNLSRQNKQLLGVKIFPHSWLNKNHVDFIIVSSEKEKYKAIKQMLIKNTSTAANILCWKDEILKQV
jgi:glycosyltransferase involved in cell wall biosynthesis